MRLEVRSGFIMEMNPLNKIGPQSVISRGPGARHWTTKLSYKFVWKVQVLAGFVPKVAEMGVIG